MRVVPINDWGEVGFPVVRHDRARRGRADAEPRDAVHEPGLAVPGTLPGRAEPGSTVSIEGAGPLEVDDRGRFTVVTRLAPWPQTIRLTATDASGNASVGEFSIVGGVDYRQFPWALIAALTLLGVVAARGLAAAGKTGAAASRRPRGRRASLDDASMPEIEELPPGAGLARR